jgi:ribonucleotide monophosphatase NagD (HAD superfamily)
MYNGSQNDSIELASMASGSTNSNITLSDVCGQNLSRERKNLTRGWMEACGMEKPKEIKDLQDAGASHILDADGNLTGLVDNKESHKDTGEPIQEHIARHINNSLTRARALFNTLNEANIPQVVASNDARVKGYQKAQKLMNLGYNVKEGQCYTALDSSIDFFKNVAQNAISPQDRNIVVFGLPSLEEGMREAGMNVLPLSEARNAKYLLAGEMDYGVEPTPQQKDSLYKAAEEVHRNGGSIKGTNKDEYMMHNGDKKELIGIWFSQEMERRGIDVEYLGKPSGVFFELARARAYEVSGIPIEQSRVCFTSGDYPEMESRATNEANRLSNGQCQYVNTTTLTGVTKSLESTLHLQGDDIPHNVVKDHRKMYLQVMKPTVQAMLTQPTLDVRGHHSIAQTRESRLQQFVERQQARSDRSIGSNPSQESNNDKCCCRVM